MRRRTAEIILLAAFVLGLAAAPARAEPRVYVAAGTNDDAEIAAMDVQAGGSLTGVPGSPFATGRLPRTVLISHDGRFLFASNRSDHVVAVYAIGDSGAISPIAGSPFPTGGFGPTTLALTPDGDNLYALNQPEGSITVFAVAGDGALTQVGAKVTIPGLPVPYGVGVTPDGARLYVVDSRDGHVYGYSIAAGGGITPLGGSPFAVGGNPTSIRIAPDGGFMYLGAGAGGIIAKGIAADGSLTAVPGSPFAAGSGAVGLALSSDGSRLYAANGLGDTISAFTIGLDGALVPVPGSPFSTGTDVFALAVTPARNLLYAPLIAGGVFGHLVAADGSLTTVPASPFATDTTNQGGADAIAITPSVGPAAALVAPGGQPGAELPFDARASSDPDGQVARYDWDFGDGAQLSNGGPTPRHAYAQPGDYTVTLTVTDDAGCSTEFTYTGQMASCAGGPAARIRRTIAVRDTIGPRLTLGPAARKLTRRLSLRVACDEACSLVTRGTIAISAPDARRRRLSLRGDAATAISGQSETLTLELPKKARTLGRKALARGGKVRLRFVITATDLSANPTTQALVRKLG